MAGTDIEVDTIQHQSKKIKVGDRGGILGILMLTPATIYIALLVGLPFILAILLSLSSATVGDPGIHEFVGLKNFITVLHQPAFPIALRNSVIVTLAVLIITLIMATAQSELMVHEFRGKRLVQILLILPWAMPVSLVAVNWLWLLDSQFSPVDWLLRKAGLLGPGSLFGPMQHLYYYGREWVGLGAITIINVWRLLPLGMIIVLAGRSSIPSEIYEQAQIDGARFFRVLFRITIPALMPILVVVILFTALMVFGDMALTAMTTHGGPGHSTQILPYWAYVKGIEGGALSEGAAVALFMFPILLAAAIAALRLAFRKQH